MPLLIEMINRVRLYRKRFYHTKTSILKNACVAEHTQQSGCRSSRLCFSSFNENSTTTKRSMETYGPLQGHSYPHNTPDPTCWAVLLGCLSKHKHMFLFLLGSLLGSLGYASIVLYFAACASRDTNVDGCFVAGDVAFYVTLTLLCFPFVILSVVMIAYGFWTCWQDSKSRCWNRLLRPRAILISVLASVALPQSRNL